MSPHRPACFPDLCCSEEWGRRISALRHLLQEREGEVAELQRMLEDSQRQQEGGHALAAQQAQRVAALEERIRQLLRQLEAAEAGAAGRGAVAAALESAPALGE